MLRAVLYIRMSTMDQATSPEQQRRELLQRFGNTYEIVGEYLDEGKSGSKDVEKRTEFLRLLADSAKGQFQIILCYDLSRFSRLDTIEGAEAKKILRDNRIRLVTVVEGEIDWQTSTGRIIDTVLSESQHEYALKIASNTLRGKLDRAKKGKLFGQLTPYGLARRITEPNGAVRIVPRTETFQKPKDWEQVFIAGEDQEVSTVRWLFSEFSRRDVSFHQLARELNQQGIPSPKGKKWVYQTVVQILTNVRYAGDLSLGKDGAGRHYRLNGDVIERNTEKKMKTNKPNPVLIQNTHEALIERTLFDEVQAKVKRRWRSGKHSCREEGFALSGVLYCGGCGKPLFGNDGTKRSKSRDGVRYVCKGIHRSPDTECGQWGIHEEEIFPFLLRVLLEQVDTLTIKMADTPQPQLQSCDTTRLERKLAKLTEDYRAGLQRFLRLPADLHGIAGDLDDQLKKWKAEIEKTQEAIESIRNGDDSWNDVLRRRLQWWRTMKDRLTFIATFTFRSKRRSYSVGANVTDSGIRELLHRIDCRLTLWFERASTHRYRIVRGRLTAGSRQLDLDPADFDKNGLVPRSNGAADGGSDSALFDHPASLIV